MKCWFLLLILSWFPKSSIAFISSRGLEQNFGRTEIRSSIIYQHHRLQMNINNNDNDNDDNPSMIIVFGRPGAGKTTVAVKAAEQASCQSLDLDVCVPQWMRDNFAQGMYPTLPQRVAFAQDACDYVEKERCPKTIVSFSFVNTDLRNVFRERFPLAVWALVDTTEEDAVLRIAQREGHFYKGDNNNNNNIQKDDLNDSTEQKQEQDNSDWDFAPVTFAHVLLPGGDSIEENAQRVVDLLN